MRRIGEVGLVIMILLIPIEDHGHTLNNLSLVWDYHLIVLFRLFLNLLAFGILSGFEADEAFSASLTIQFILELSLQNLIFIKAGVEIEIPKNTIQQGWIVEHIHFKKSFLEYIHIVGGLEISITELLIS